MAGQVELWIPEQRRFLLNPDCISCTNPEDDPSTFAVSRHWKMVLHPDQTVPGAVLVVSLRHVAKLSDLTDDEAADFFGVATALERSLENHLTATMVNFSCLRNWSYRQDDPTPQLGRERVPRPRCGCRPASGARLPESMAGLAGMRGLRIRSAR